MRVFLYPDSRDKCNDYDPYHVRTCYTYDLDGYGEKPVHDLPDSMNMRIQDDMDWMDALLSP